MMSCNDVIKDQKKNQARHLQNRKYKTLIKNQLKKIASYFSEKENNPQELKKMLSMAQKVLDKASNKKIIHKNKAARRKSKLHKLVYNLNNSVSE